MTDALQHECGLAIIRLLHPLEYYQKKYGSALWGLHKMFLLMGKQHNRGQDGAGLAAIKLDMPPGHPFMHRERISEPAPPWQALFKKIDGQLALLQQKHPTILNDPALLKEHFRFGGELLMGHLRYATHGLIGEDNCHPVLRTNNWQTRNLALAGNFNMTNVDALFQKLIELGQHPQLESDTVTALERIGHFLDRQNQELFDRFKAEGFDNQEISLKIAEALDLTKLMRRACKYWDGGYTMGGLLGHGDFFVVRDPWGIRPAFYCQTDEFIAMASERPALATAFNLPIEQIEELASAHILVVKKSGALSISQFAEPQKQASCSFERIYFSRGSDKDIYRERMALGRFVTPAVLNAVGHDLKNTVFSFIPNTAQAAFWGMLKALEDNLNEDKARRIAVANLSDPGLLVPILAERVRVEQVIHKDTNLRTFITGDMSRDDMAAHVYDITYGTIRPGQDNLVCIDDSIVRGTTLKQSILKMLARLGPKCIVIVSSAPQIRYPDCYGIDMSQIGRFIAFQAAIALLKGQGKEGIIEQVYRHCLQLKAEGLSHTENCVKAIYEPFTEQQISDKIAALLHTPDLGCPVKIVYQPLANLPLAIPNHTGDWYFSGNYPTPGGNTVVNQAFINFIEGSSARAY